MKHSAAFKRCLEQCDVAGIRDLWAHVQPKMPQPKNDEEALFSIHYARTVTKSIAIKLRAYSHRWLTERDFPSGLPDELKAKAERLYPRVVTSVGISYNVKKGSLLEPVRNIIRGSMEEAVLEAYADDRTDPVHLKARMQEAKDTTIRKLIGI